MALNVVPTESPSEVSQDTIMSTTEIATHFGISSRHARLRAAEYKLRNEGDQFPTHIGKSWAAPLSIWRKILDVENPNTGRPRSGGSPW